MSIIPALAALILMFSFMSDVQVKSIAPTATVSPVSANSTNSEVKISSTHSLFPTPTTLPKPEPVFEPNITTYGNNICEDFTAGGFCKETLTAFPLVITNLSRSDQKHAQAVTDRIFATILNFKSSQECIHLAIPLLCRYSFPTCDPAFRMPTYQPVCQRDCRAAELFVCREPWLQMLALADILNFDVIDTFDCSPLQNPNAGEAPMCISTVDIFQGEIPLPLQSGPDCYRDHGRGYNGTVNITESGFTCQAWSSTYPHQHLLGYENHPELEGGHNYCRNPGERGERPWCFTTNRTRRWDYCDIPRCPGSACENYQGDVCYNKGMIGYDKVFINNTQGSFQANYEDGLMKLNSILNGPLYSSECRNIFLELLCATNFPSCDLAAAMPTPIRPCRSFCQQAHQVCGELLEDIKQFRLVADIGPVEILFNCSVLYETEAGDLPECFLPIERLQDDKNDTCYQSQDKGVSYYGTVSTTESGKECQSWSSQFPHQHAFSPKARVYLSNHSHCRNPERRGDKPWCFTTDPNTRWEYCDIPVCATEASIDLPVSTITLISAVVPAGVLLLVILLFIAVCICCCCMRRSDSATFPIPKEHSGATHVYVKSGGATGKDVSELGPLYCRNPLATESPIEYDGVKLPEIARDTIVYTKDLGQGHFGVVVQAEARSVGTEGKPQTVAVKVLKPGASAQMQKEFFREAALMNAFDHPNILRLFGVCIDQEPLCIVFEFMERGDLNNFLRLSSNAIPVAQLVEFCIEIASGLEYLAQNHYVHRDLATRNCLVSSTYHVKISDFGLSQDIYSSDYFTLGDTELLPIRWMPPEAILYSKFTTQSDVWSFGVVLWEIFSFGIQPYYTMSNEEVVQHVRDGNVMKCPDNCPSELYDLMIDCWAMNPTDRPTAAELNGGLRRWTPNLSAMIQEEQRITCDYQNMATVREYAQAEAGHNNGASYDHLLSLNDPTKESAM